VFDEAGARVAATIAGAARKKMDLIKCILSDSCMSLEEDGYRITLKHKRVEIYA
jgi:hypothetical protein